MKKLTLILALLVTMVTTAMAQINYGKSLWTFPATGHEAVSEVPSDIFTDFATQYSDTELTNEKVGVYVTTVRVAAEGDVTATFVYNGGNIRMDIGGVDLVDADGNVVELDYHFGYAGGNSSNNTYTLESVAEGDYTMRFFVTAQKEDITSATSNDSRGTITLAGWLYPEANVFYNIKNVRSSKYATFKGVGNEFKAEDANNGAGSYWYFVEASLDDVKSKNGAWLEDGAIPAGYKPYYVYNAACEKAVENVGNGYMAAPGESPYPAKLYYIGVKTNGEKKGFVLRPCNEDGSSWNDNTAGSVCHWNSGDPGSVWRIEPTNVTESNLIAMGTTAKNNALATVTTYEQAYYFNPTTAKVNEVQKAINDIDCLTKEKALTSVIDGTANAIANEITNYAVTPKAGDRFMMKNRGRGGNNYLRAYANDNTVKCSDYANDLNALDLVWTLVASDADGFFKLYNERHEVYVGALSTSDNTIMKYTSDPESAGLYEISQAGVYTLFHAKGQNATGYMHQSNWGSKEIVRWDNGDCSQWQLIEAPIELTTDLAAPICYAIKSGRDGNYYFTLENNKIKLVNNADIVGNDNAKWFFMLDGDKNLKIYPYADKNNTMGYITVADGNTKLTNNHSAEGFVADTYNLYYNTNNAAGNNGKCFAFRPTVGNTFVSNHGGTGNYMGFYNEHNDKGTRIGFENINKVDLKNKIATWEPYIAHEGDKLGQYVISDEIKTAINNAPNVVATKSSTDAAYKEIVTALKAPFPTINMPETGKYYYLNYNGSYLSNVKETTLIATAEKSISNIFYYEGNGENTYLLDYQNGHYVTNPWNIGIGEAAVNGHATERYKQTKSFVEGGIGYYALKYHADNGNDYYFTVNGGATNSTINLADNKVQCTLEEVTTLPVTITAAGYASFHAPVAVTVPSGIEAHYLTKIIGEFASMTKIESGIIPANTGVMLTGTNGEPATEGTYYFEITDDVSPIEGNMFEGTVATEYVTGDAYVLAIKDNNVGLYSAILNKKDESAFQNNSHKAYLPASALTPAQMSAGFRFSFGGTTDIEEVETESENVKAIYDLTGRKLESIASPGIYIIDGKKIIIR